MGVCIRLAGAGVHDFVLGLISAGTSTSSGTDSTVKVAIVTAVGLVIAAAITAFASTFQRERAAHSPAPAADNFTRDYINGLVRDQRELRNLREKHYHLREACLERDLDPDQLIHEQENQS